MDTPTRPSEELHTRDAQMQLCQEASPLQRVRHLCQLDQQTPKTMFDPSWRTNISKDLFSKEPPAQVPNRHSQPTEGWPAASLSIPERTCPTPRPRAVYSMNTLCK